MKKPSLAGIMGDVSGPEEPEHDAPAEDEEGDMEGAKADSLQAFLDAIEAKDLKAMGAALDAYLDLRPHGEE